MLLRQHGVHLCYCTNIHPGETWPEVKQNLKRYLPAVKARVSPDSPFGVGLRLSAQSAAALEDEAEIDWLRTFFAAEELYVFTINGFPHGVFHGARVKEAVYLPDWLDEERLRYTDQLARVLCRLLPVETHGTISTVPGAFRRRVRDPADERRIAGLLLRHAKTLHRILDETGRHIELALEPEPWCLLETTSDVVRFFEAHLHSEEAVKTFAQDTGLSTAKASDFLRRHLTTCIDACHMAVEFEDAREGLHRLERAGIRIGKVQLSAGLEVDVGTSRSEIEKTVRSLEAFSDGVYLHQVVARRSGALARYLDLPEAVGTAFQASSDETWRIHFHVPIFQERFEQFRSTQPFLSELLSAFSERRFTQHLEVETYTWDVLPVEHRGRHVVDAIATELQWVLSRLT